MKAQPSRSARVLAAVQAGGPVTLEALAAEVGATERQVYTCLWWIAKRGALPANGRAAMAPKVPQRGNREEGHVCEGARPSRPRRLHVVTNEDGPHFETCTAEGGLRREMCERYEACLDAAARAAMAHARCPRSCAWYTPRDRARELYHLAASRPGDGPTS